MTDYKVGDTITLYNKATDDTLHREVTELKTGSESGSLWVTIWPFDGVNNGVGRKVSDLIAMGWQITDVKPKPEPLPSEPNALWLDAHDNVWRTDAKGRLGVVGDAQYMEDHPEHWVPFVRLRPEADVRRELLDAVIDCVDSEDTRVAVDLVNKRFGVNA